MSADASEVATTPSPAEAFLAHVRTALDEQALGRLVLSKYRGAEPDLLRVALRPLVLRGVPSLSFVYSHATRDITKNLPRAEGLQQLRTLLAHDFSHAHLLTATHETQLRVSKKGRQTLHRAPLPAAAQNATTPAVSATSTAQMPAPEGRGHDREKHRWLDLNAPFLVELGVTNAQHQLVPAMARKWKQINKFIEVLAAALAASTLTRDQPLRVMDFGSGKGYLTFAMHAHLRASLGVPARVTGVELRPELVALCNGVARRLALDGLDFEHGDVSRYARQAALPSIDIMVALHACDTATDHAIHMGVRAGAAIIMCSPCCHKQLRPQLLSPHPLRPILQHGVHLGQEAEMLTDGLRALLLDACGYDTQVFEFIALEHTNKNKMILAVKREKAGPADAAWQQVREIKAFYGIRDQCLETLLLADRA